MELYNLSPAAGSTKEAFRKGRGHGSGAHGGAACI